MTVGFEGMCFDHSIVFAHSNLHPHVYKYLEAFDDLILVCSWHQQMEAVKQWGKPVFLPMSVDIGYVEQFKREKDRDICFAGRMEKCTDELRFTPGLDFIAEVDRVSDGAGAIPSRVRDRPRCNRSEDTRLRSPAIR